MSIFATTRFSPAIPEIEHDMQEHASEVLPETTSQAVTSTSTSAPDNSWLNVGRGFLMGGADIIPGVSGGTVALILGIYQRLITAISHTDLKLISLLKDREWKAAAKYWDLWFLICLGSGIGLGIGGLASLMHYLLEHQMAYTFSVFFGLILGSSLLVGKMVTRWTPEAFASLQLGAVFAWFLVELPLLKNSPDHPAYYFLCGSVAICAMILPGISGAFILLLLGKYHDVTGMIKATLSGNLTPEMLLTLAVFGTGCLIGLISFSKFLRWLLSRYEMITLATLCGVMLGSLNKLWPIKIDTTPEILEFKEKTFKNIWPEEFASEYLAMLVLAFAAFLLIFVLERVGSRTAHAK